MSLATLIQVQEWINKDPDREEPVVIGLHGSFISGTLISYDKYMHAFIISKGGDPDLLPSKEELGEEDQEKGEAKEDIPARNSYCLKDVLIRIGETRINTPLLEVNADAVMWVLSGNLNEG